MESSVAAIFIPFIRNASNSLNVNTCTPKRIDNNVCIK
jgi:hypothetical protein